MNKNSFLLALLTGSALYPMFAYAQADTEKSSMISGISGDVVMELQSEQTINSDDDDSENNNTFWRTEVAPTVQINENLAITGNLVLEPTQAFDEGESNFFEEEGVFIEELKLTYDNGPYHAFAGKFNPGFGVAWEWGRGIWGEDFAEDYEMTEKLGFGGGYTVEGGGTHTLTLSTFFADTTMLSDSAFTTRGDLDKHDGGVGNTEDFSSYVAALEGENVFNIENAYYKLGYRHQAEGDEDVGGHDENGYEVTLGHVFPLSDNISEDALLEYANISNFEGSADDVEYLTASFITKINERWNITLGYTARNVDVDDGDQNDHLLQLSGGYDFGNGLTLEAGWRNSDEADTDTDILGALARYQFQF